MFVIVLAALVLLGCGSPPPSHACVRALTAYGDQACFARDDGAVYCWGGNGEGQLGIGTFSPPTSSIVPQRAMIDDVVALASGEDTVCATKSDGSLSCWGEGRDGQLGNGAVASQAVPTPVPGLANVIEVRGAQHHTCARLLDGSGWCWGANDFGELGSPPPTGSAVPAPAPIGDAHAIALGDRITCALRQNQIAECWGANAWGGLGDGTTISRDTPAAVAIPDPITNIAGGCHEHLCATSSLGEVWCWGNNMRGQLGRGTITPFEVMPARVAGLTNAVQVAVGAFHSCIRTSTSEVWCWGANTDGQLGDGTFDDRATPVRTNGVIGALVDIQLTCGTTFVVRDNGTLVGWGSRGQLIDETLNQSSPAEIPLPCD